MAYKGYVYTDIGKYDDALRTYNICLSENKDDPKQHAKFLSEIGYVYDRMKSYRKSIEYNREALKYANDEEGIGRAYGMIGIAYDELEQFDSALYNNYKALDQFKKGGISGLESVWLSNTGNTLVKIKEFEKALTLLWRADSINQSVNFSSPVLLTNIGRALMGVGRMLEAKDYIEKSVTASRLVSNKRSEEEAEQILSEWFEANGNYKEALEHFKLHTIIKDSLYELDKVKEADELQLKYETASKNRLLAEKELEIERKNAEVSQSNFRNILFGVLATVLAILLFAVYRVQVQRRRRLRAENEQKMTAQKLTISKELHDNIGSQLTFIIHSLENAAFVTDSDHLKHMLNQLSENGREALDDLRNTVWVMKTENGSTDTLLNKFKEIKSRVYSMNIDVSNAANEVMLTSVQLMNLFRIGQEAIQNSVKYSQSNRLEVSLFLEDKNLILSIKDFGIGFNVNQSFQGNGLIHMKERAEAINAHIDIYSTQNGTEVKVGLNISSPL